MKNKGRPRQANTRGEYLEVRLDVREKTAFKEAADLAGLALSAWVRERLRQAARQELQASGRTVAFLDDV
jgi:predicted HicB family RNase H-like nuclease